MRRDRFDDTIRRDPIAEMWRMIHGQPTLASAETGSVIPAASPSVVEDKTDKPRSTGVEAQRPTRRID